MSLSTTYKEYILEKLMLDYFHEGKIPTSEDLENDLAKYMENHPNLEEPISKSQDWTVEPGENSSASKIHEIADYFSQDIGVVTREIYRIANQSIKFHDRWSSEMKRLSGYARKLEQRVDSLLLLNKDTAGFFAYAGDVFADMNKIDTESTTAKIDLYETSVTINNAHDELSGTGSLIELNVDENNVSFAPLTKKPGIAYMTAGEDNIISNLFKANNSSWVGRVVSDSPGQMVCELKAKLADKDLEVSRIAFQFTGPLGTTNSTVSCLYSDNGYTWSLVPTVEPTKTLLKNTSWSFPITKMRWIKFVFTKAAQDSADNEYIFAMSHIKLYGNNYDSSAGDTLFTSSLQALNEKGEPILFSLVSLDACEEIPANCGIDYSVSASQDGDSWTDWIYISPSERSLLSYPKIINLGGADWKDNSEPTTLLDTSVEEDNYSQMRSTKNFDSEYLGYRFKDSNFKVINTAISITDGEDPDSVGSSVVVWRNIRYKNLTDYPDTLTVRGNPRGWGVSESDYTCYFEVLSSDGLLLDFGDKPCVIDGVSVSGVLTIPKGVHKFSTNKENWFDISNTIIDKGLSSPSKVSTDEKLKEIDPLYPYNHKLIIEGFPYDINFKGEKVYVGTDISAEFFSTKSSLFDLENNHQEYGYFSVRGVGNEENPTLGVIIKSDVGNTDDANELFLVKWRSGATDTSMYKYVKLKAKLWTEDSGVTPSLTSYRIKLGI